MDIDLFGDPVSAPKDGRGRPEFIWTLEKSNRVLLGLVRGLTQAQIALTISCDVKTLRKHFSRELATRKAATLRFEMRQLERLNALAVGGSVAAEKELAKRLDTLRMRDASEKFAAAPKAKKVEKVGKKEQRRRAAQLAGAGDEEWGELGIAPSATAH